MNYYHPISNAYATTAATTNVPGNGSGSGYATFFDKLNQAIIENWPMLAGAAGINLFLTLTKLITGPLAKVWMVTGFIGLAVAGYGFVASGGKIGNTSLLGGQTKANYAYY